MKNAKNIYAVCVKQYHDVLIDITGKVDVIVVPELEEHKKRAITELIDDAELDYKFINDRFQYQFVLIAMSVQYGAVHVAIFHKEPEKYNGLIEQINNHNLNAIATYNLINNLGVDQGFINQVYSWIFDEWDKLYNPKWTLDTARNQMIATYEAAYQFGVSWYMQSVQKK